MLINQAMRLWIWTYQADTIDRSLQCTFRWLIPEKGTVSWFRTPNFSLLLRRSNTFCCWLILHAFVYLFLPTPISDLSIRVMATNFSWELGWGILIITSIRNTCYYYWWCLFCHVGRGRESVGRGSRMILSRTFVMAHKSKIEHIQHT
jgi:hypothetical protein